MLTHSCFLHDEIIELLKNTYGMNNFCEIQIQMNDCVDYVTVMNHLKLLDDYTLQKIRLLPAIDKVAEQR